ncbi:MAG: RNA polymerase sigma factor (sigma-70 family) [Dokdonia sp.]|jgi:RNA polymerase sigma-70 factor (ECF subfamily)
MTDSELVKACLENNARAQKALFEMYSPKFMGVCLRYAQNQDEANDMLQDGFIKIFQKLKSYSGSGSFGGWMHRTIVNTCLDTLRKNKKFKFSVEIEHAEGQVFTSDTALSDIRTKELMQLVQRLPDGYRVVFNMFAIEGYGHKEIAEKLGVTENTSKSQYRKARFWLQKELIELDKIIE